jgi:hypothetical protein
MEYRAQTYLGAVQLLAVFAGSMILRAAVKGLDNILNPDLHTDPLRFLRPLGQYGWLLSLVPIAWVVLTIRGERSDLWWATKPLTLVSGFVLLFGIVGLFGWAGFAASMIASGGP